MDISIYPCLCVSFSGAMFSDITKVFALAEVQWMSKTTFYDYQHSHILPVITTRFEQSLEESRNTVNEVGLW